MNNFNYKFCRGAAVLLMATSLSGCGMWSRLQQVGQEPPLAPITNPVEAKNYEPVSMPMPQVNDAKGGANSLWKPGSSGFFKDLRASKVGDIITVKVSAKDNALMETRRNRIAMTIKIQWESAECSVMKTILTGCFRMR